MVTRYEEERAMGIGRLLKPNQRLLLGTLRRKEKNRVPGQPCGFGYGVLSLVLGGYQAIKR